MGKVKPRVIVIMGPTASGKSDAAIRLAKKYDGEIISADSRQIYRGMDIGTGKVIKDDSMSKEQEPKNKYGEQFISEGVIHHLIDVAQPMEDFNVSHFKKEASAAIEHILAKGKLPIICGGTGFWIDAVVNDTQLPEVAPNDLLRSKLQSKSAGELFSLLQEKDPERAVTIDPHNKVRLIRALEIIQALGSVPRIRNAHYKIHHTKYNFLQIALDIPRETLNAKIKKRLDQRFHEGMVDEIEKLHANGVSYAWMEKIGLEYRWIARFLQGKVSEKEMREKLFYDIIHYAKRQMTWLRKNPAIRWQSNYDEMEEAAGSFLSE